ncbi:hypothetical protein PI125_g19364 [Phytophthora idaei]|nr:hypothetical protein PI125_g19364 [Phytophthora idaei]KAG3136366.1 hypothetical protein PI126_g17856 [Phytophthora idaei]
MATTAKTTSVRLCRRLRLVRTVVLPGKKKRRRRDSTGESDDDDLFEGKELLRYHANWDAWESIVEVGLQDDYQNVDHSVDQVQNKVVQQVSIHRDY